MKDRLADVKLNRLAFIEAVDYLTRSSFDENDGKIASHIIKLAVMICEAARYESIKQHVASNYDIKTHEETASLSVECIASIYTWSPRSVFLQRGGVYAGERRLMGEDPTVIMDIDEERKDSE